MERRRNDGTREETASEGRRPEEDHTSESDARGGGDWRVTIRQKNTEGRGDEIRRQGDTRHCNAKCISISFDKIMKPALGSCSFLLQT